MTEIATTNMPAPIFPEKEPKKEEPVELGKDQLKQLLQKEQESRVKSCSGELNALLQKYNCTLVGVTIIIEGNIQQRVELKPLE